MSQPNTDSLFTIDWSRGSGGTELEDDDGDDDDDDDNDDDDDDDNDDDDSDEDGDDDHVGDNFDEDDDDDGCDDDEEGRMMERWDGGEMVTDFGEGSCGRSRALLDKGEFVNTRHE